MTEHEHTWHPMNVIDTGSITLAERYAAVLRTGTGMLMQIGCACGAFKFVEARLAVE